MSFDSMFSAILQAFIFPFQLLISPLDALIKNIPGIEVIPDTIATAVGVVGTIPSTLVNLFGINPLIWNLTFLVFLAYIGIVPTINGFKKVIAWLT